MKIVKGIYAEAKIYTDDVEEDAGKACGFTAGAERETGQCRLEGTRPHRQRKSDTHLRGREVCLEKGLFIIPLLR